MNQQLSSLRSQLLKLQEQLPQLLEDCLGKRTAAPRIALYPAAKVRQAKLPVQPR